MMGLGPADDGKGKVSLAAARLAVAEARGKLRAGTDPIESRAAGLRSRQAEQTQASFSRAELLQNCNDESASNTIDKIFFS